MHGARTQPLSLSVPEEERTIIDSRVAPATVRTTILPRVDRLSEVPVLIHEDHLRYEDVRALGAGAAGDVVLARDNDIHREVAVKRLRATATDLDAVTRFIEEIRTIGQLDHPGITPIHDVGVDEQGRYFFVMKRVQGETLASLLERLKAGDPVALRRYPTAQRVQLFMQVLRVLDFAHARGFIHRDLKPANIMVGPYGEVVVMDWGLAKRIKGAPAAPAAPAGPGPPAAPDGTAERLFATHHGALLGTPAYMSPEQAAGQNPVLDARSDIYALCVILHELLTLRHYLAHQTTLHGMLFAIMKEPPTLHPGGGVPPELYYVLRRGLAKDPAQRYQSVAELSAELEEIQAGRIHVVCPLTGTRRLGQEFMRLAGSHPWAAVCGLLAAGGLALCGAAQGVARLLALLH